MEDKPPLPINPNGLIRSYLAQQHTAQQPAVTPLPAVVQPVTPLPAALQPKTVLLPVVASPTRRVPVLIKPSGVSTPVFSLAQLPTRPRVPSDAVRLAATMGDEAGGQQHGAWQAYGDTRSPGTRSVPANTRIAAQPKQTAVPISQPTAALPVVTPLAPDLPIDETGETPEQAEARAAKTHRKRAITRVILVFVAMGLVATLYIIWHGSATPVTSPTVTQQPLTTPTSATNASSTGAGGMIQVYIIGAVQHPGVYKLESGARVYELLRVAGGPLPSADLVTLNLAAKLSDGEEVYVLAIGETPPVSVTSPPVSGTSGTATGSLVNINTASVTDMRQLLHVSSTTAQKIVDYRQQHGSYTSVDQLLQVVSKSIYDKIKALVMV